AAARAADAPLLLRDPTISRTHIAFVFGGAIWTVDRRGGPARRLVTGQALAGHPYFSPDGTKLAYSANYDGNVSVYVIPAAGGEPRRLTYHPSPSVAVGWTPDGKRVIFRSRRDSTNDPDRLFTVAVAGDFPRAFPLPSGEEGALSADESHLAYVPTMQWEPFWKGYRGGQTTPVWIANLADSSVVKIPRANSNDTTPMWVGDRVYFLSDRDGAVTLFSYDDRSRRVSRTIAPGAFDITSASANGGEIVYSQFGTLHVFDPASGRSEAVHVDVASDLPAVRPHWEKVGTQIRDAAISPTGVRAVFEAHGEILTVPAEHGAARNISETPGAAARTPAWSPDGRWIAYFSDVSGEYTLQIRDQRGADPPRRISLGSTSTYYYVPTWSPDSKKIAYADSKLGLWYVDLARPTPVRVATSPFALFSETEFEPAWSPDSRWITYPNQLPNYLHAIFVYSVDGRTTHQVTDGMSDARSPIFDRSGKYLYFTASTNTGLTTSGLDMIGDQRPISRSVYAAVLRKETAEPLPVQSDDEPATASPAPAPSGPIAAPAPSGAAAPAAAAPRPGAAAQPVRVTIDFDRLGQRIVALPLPDANYVGLAAGRSGDLFLAVAPAVAITPGPPNFEVQKFDAKTRSAKPFLTGVSAFELSANGEKALYRQQGRWSIVDVNAPLTPGKGLLDTASLEVEVDPRAEWTQMYHEAWRLQRAFFYDPHYHGLDIDTAEKRFAPYL
ncbi:MAG: PD40 domain-containing protein, partial [Candidatus Eremiobacteraeota bacterium]|nr:PD40 domain-containing protein [Candidatus Eremiobacteraeota bacterium]